MGRVVKLVHLSRLLPHALILLEAVFVQALPVCALFGNEVFHYKREPTLIFLRIPVGIRLAVVEKQMGFPFQFLRYAPVTNPVFIVAVLVRPLIHQRNDDADRDGRNGDDFLRPKDGAHAQNGDKPQQDRSQCAV